MGVLDQRITQLNGLVQEMRSVTTLEDYLRLQYRRFQLHAELRQGHEELARVARGWVFVPPSGKPTG